VRVEDIRELLRAGQNTRTWLEHLETIGEPNFEVRLPSAGELPPVLLDLAVPHEDIGALVALLPSLRQSQDLWWLLERCAHSLVRDMGTLERPPWFPELPESIGVMHRYFYVYVFLAVLPQVREYHRSRGIPEDVSRLSLADLGRHMAVYRRHFGCGGLDAPFWMMLHFRGTIYDLGRLQFERTRLGDRLGGAISSAGLPYGPGDLALSVHIPQFWGPMTPEACDASFERAKTFFARHFPEEQYGIAVCHSWLLDDQLAEYLPETSNIVRFQRRFQLAYRLDVDDQSIIRFVTGRINPKLEELPRRTVLERAIVDHLQAGRHWHGGAGWVKL
jgi:hypothetical protein